jgi:hypothetical protein
VTVMIERVARGVHQGGRGRATGRCGAFGQAGPTRPVTLSVVVS